MKNIKLLIASLCLITVTSNICRAINAPDNWVKKKTYTTQNGSRFIEETNFYNGLGMPDQNIITNSMDKGKSIVQPIYYDNMGRSDLKTYLPFYISKHDGKRVEDPFNSKYYEGAYGKKESPYTYHTNNFDNSPLNRIVSSRNAGIAYSESDIRKHYSYDSNDSNEVFYISHSLIEHHIEVEGYYPSNSLEKRSIFDEDGSVNIEYVDMEGKIILTRVVAEDKNIDTYYVYDLKGRLTWVISPAGSSELVCSAIYSSSDIWADQYCYIYKYDNRNRMIEKKIPGKSHETFIYDDLNRLIMYLDGNSRDFLHPDYPGEKIHTNRWISYEYDLFGRRTAERMAYICEEEIEDFLTFYPDFLNAKDRFLITTVAEYKYGNGAFQSSYSNLPKYLAYKNLNIIETVPIETVPVDLKFYEKIAILEKSAIDKYIERAFYYDEKGRLIQTVEKNVLGGISRYSTKYDFTGNVLASHESHQTAESDIQMPKSICEILLQDVGSAKMSVIKYVKQITGLGLKEAKDIVDAAPAVMSVECEKFQGLSYVAELRNLGASAILQSYTAAEAVDNIPTDTKLTEYSYDHRGRLLTECTTLNGGKEAKVGYDYDDLGRLICKSYETNNPVNTEVVDLVKGQYLNITSNIPYNLNIPNLDLSYFVDTKNVKEEYKVNNMAGNSYYIPEKLYSKLFSFAALQYPKYYQIGIEFRGTGTPLEQVEVIVDHTVKETFNYNVQGWLTSQNSSLFNSSLHYYNPREDVTARWNGNIAEWRWWHNGENPMNSYGFEYDKANYLKDTIINTSVFERETLYGMMPTNYSGSMT